MALSPELKEKIDSIVHANKVVLFMKGNRHFPQCGFSAQVVQILNGLLPKYETQNVLADPALREGIKEYSSWPTIPQLYIAGQFIGGCDIVKEMHASGELQKLLGVEAKAPAPPTVTLTERAAKALKDASAEPGEDRLRLEVTPQFQHELYFGPKRPGDLEITPGGVAILVDPGSAGRAAGIAIDFVDTADGGAFRIDNPNEPPRVRSMSVKELKSLFDKGDRVELFDVRTPDERARAVIPQSVHLDAEGERRLLALDKNARVVFVCHHGQRSRMAAERLVREGWRNVYNLEGGIDAWSMQVDPSVPRY